MSEVNEPWFYSTEDPEHLMNGDPIPALTSILYHVCDRDQARFNEACRLIRLFVAKATEGVTKQRDEAISALYEKHGDWSDKPLPEDPEIAAAHPVVTGKHYLYKTAMRLVGARYSKHGLVELVNWLLWRLETQKPQEPKQGA